MRKTIQDPKNVDKLYEKYGRPLEEQHWGEFLGISREGKTVLGKTLLEVAQKAVKILGPGNFLFKVGEKSVGKLRRL